MTQVAEAEVPMAGNVKDIVNRLSRDMTNRVPFSVHTQNERRERQLFVGTFAYTSQQEDELSFSVGDIIELIEEVEDGWSRGRLKSSGAIGMFPTNFVTVKTISSTIRPKIESTVVMRDEPKAIERTPSTVLSEILKPSDMKFVPQTSAADSKTKEMARVKFVYNPQHPDELSLSELDVLINVVNKNCGDAGWFEGELAGKKGLFPDNFVELVQVPLATESGAKFSTINRIAAATSAGSHHHKPPPVNPPQPAVPPKPLKMKVEPTSSSTITTNATPTPISPTTSSNTIPPFTSSTTATAAASGASVGGTTNAKKDAFAALRDKITSNLKVVGPSPLHTPTTTKTSTFESEDGGSSAAGAEPIMDTNSSGDQVSELQHITKSRARPQKNRPMSMVMNRNRSTDESPLGTRLSSPTANAPMSTSMFTTTNIIAQTKEVSSSSTPFKSSASSSHQQPVLPPSSASKPALRPILPVASLVEETRSDMGDYVSRAEYDALLERVRILENRLASIENRKF